MSVWYAISGEWLFLLNPALWLLFFHIPILFFLLRRKMKHPVSLIIIVCLWSPVLSWIFSVLNLGFEDLILEHLISRGATEYMPYYHSDGPGNVVTVLFGWAWSFILILFWAIALSLAYLVRETVRQLCNLSGKIPHDDIETGRVRGIAPTIPDSH